MNPSIDTDFLRGWVGREEVVADHLTPALAEKFHATIDLPGDVARDGDVAPRLIHFCLCQPAVGMTALGEDGHPARGGFLPPVPLPRRMWAASEIVFTGDLRVGETVTRRSTVADVVVKNGRSGTLCFVTVDHAISGDRSGLVVQDRQTIVYRGLERASPTAQASAAPQGSTRATVRPTPTLLFRYSALTFNGHRIHYDQPYATQVEGYAGLVVHGPLQATLLLHFAARLNSGQAPDRFSFRSNSTLFDREDMVLHAGDLTMAGEGGSIALWTARNDGPTAMQAEAHWL